MGEECPLAKETLPPSPPPPSNISNVCQYWPCVTPVLARNYNRINNISGLNIQFRGVIVELFITLLKLISHSWKKLGLLKFLWNIFFGVFFFDVNCELFGKIRKNFKRRSWLCFTPVTTTTTTTTTTKRTTRGITPTKILQKGSLTLKTKSCNNFKANRPQQTFCSTF